MYMYCLFYIYVHDIRTKNNMPCRYFSTVLVSSVRIVADVYRTSIFCIRGLKQLSN